MNQEQHEKKLSQVIAKCWADESFKRRLLAEPIATLKAEGVELPDGLSIKVLENTDKVFHLVIPAKPTGEMEDEDLDKVTGGFLGFFINGPAKEKPKSGGGTLTLDGIKGESMDDRHRDTIE